MSSDASLYIKHGKVSVRSYVRNGGRGQLSSERRHNENDVTMTIAGLWSGDMAIGDMWPRVAPL